MPQATQKPITLLQCQSSAFLAHGYDPATQTLALQFKSSGHIYHYPEVSVDVASSRLAEGVSLGKWYAQHIKGRYVGTLYVPEKTDEAEGQGE